MLLRPVDASGDILPVLSSSSMLSGPEAVARLAEYRLRWSAGGISAEVVGWWLCVREIPDYAAYLRHESEISR